MTIEDFSALYNTTSIQSHKIKRSAYGRLGFVVSRLRAHIKICLSASYPRFSETGVWGESNCIFKSGKNDQKLASGTKWIMQIVSGTCRSAILVALERKEARQIVSLYKGRWGAF